MSKYRIMLADDHALFREGIKRILQEDPDLTVIGKPVTASNSWTSWTKNSGSGYPGYFYAQTAGT